MRRGSLIVAASASVPELISGSAKVACSAAMMMSAGDHDLEAAAEGEAVDRGDHRLVEAGQFLQAAEAADAIVGIGRFAFGCGLEVPARAEEFVAGRGEDRDAQVRDRRGSRRRYRP